MQVPYFELCVVWVLLRLLFELLCGLSCLGTVASSSSLGEDSSSSVSVSASGLPSSVIWGCSLMIVSWMLVGVVWGSGIYR